MIFRSTEFYLNYLIATGRTGNNRQGALITSLSPNNRKNRISRRGIRYIVDNYLKQLNLKQKTNLKGDLISLSDHSLRHTFATLVYQQTQDLKLLQQALGHNDPRTTAKYAHVGNAIAAADAIQL
jgi:site-specific recombinase XerD